MRLRNFILAGLGLCILTLAFAAFRYPEIASVLQHAPKLLALMGVVLVWNAYAAVYRTHAQTSEDSMVLRDGVKWGLAVGCAWAVVAIVPVNVFVANDEAGAPFWFLGLFSGLLLPFAAGAAGAIKTGSVRIGMRFGFWSGVVGGLIGFLVVVAVGFSEAFLPSLQVWADRARTEPERIGETLLLALVILCLFGIILGAIAGTVGGWIGLRLYRTGESPVSV
jgi:predicted histidine transporter YuiF (NhaC family)